MPFVNGIIRGWARTHLFQRPLSFNQRVRNFTPELLITNRALTRSIWCRGGAGYPKRDSPTDIPILSLYRLYHFIVTDNTIELRNELEFFFNKAEWPVNAITNPKDTNLLGYAILAVLTAFTCRALNRLIAKGLPRDALPIVSDWDALAAQPRVLEEVPQWATELPKLETRLDIQDENDVFLDGSDDPKACKEFLAKNILIEEPHIYFV
jgi:hypothetical protein